MEKQFEHYTKQTLNKQLLNLPEQIEQYIIPNISLDLSKKACIFAIGESMIAGQVISAYANSCSDQQIELIQDGRVPGWINYDTTTILISYSGYNDVINNIYDELLVRNCTIICITSGGKLINRCISNGNKVFKLPFNLTPRTSIGAEIGILSSIVESIGICSAKQCLISLLPSIKKFRDSLSKGEIISDKEICTLKNKSVSIYGLSELYATCKRWKTAFNADTMSLAFCSDLPEFDHNELVGWANHRQPTNNVKMIVLKCNTSYVLSQIIDLMIDVLKENKREVQIFNIPGQNPIEKNICGIMMGDYIAQKLSSKNDIVRGPSE